MQAGISSTSRAIHIDAGSRPACRPLYTPVWSTAFWRAVSGVIVPVLTTQRSYLPGPARARDATISAAAAGRLPRQRSLMKAVLPLRLASLAVVFSLAGSALIVPVLAGYQKPGAKPSQAKPPVTQNSTPCQARADGPGQTPMESDDTIKLGTELVNVVFSVVDQNNRILSNLNQRDVTVLDDGQPQQMFTFR